MSAIRATPEAYFFDAMPSEVVDITPLKEEVPPIIAREIRKELEPLVQKVTLQVDFTLLLGVALLVGVCLLGVGFIIWTSKS